MSLLSITYNLGRAYWDMYAKTKVVSNEHLLTPKEDMRGSNDIDTYLSMAKFLFEPSYNNGIMTHFNSKYIFHVLASLP